jgi:hypothetical protein
MRFRCPPGRTGRLPPRPGSETFGHGLGTIRGVHERPTPVYTNRLQCVECGRVSRENKRGWTGHLTVDEDEPVEVATFCPECDEREFREG